MLPKILYELLPFMYLGIGLGGGMAIDSTLVFVAAALLMATGVLILVMRFIYRRKPRRMHFSR